MQAGELNHQIKITQTTTEIDEGGVEQKTIKIVKTLWVGIEHRNPSEKWSDGRMKPDVTDVFKTRYSPNITSDMGINYGAKRYEIIGVEDIRDEHREMWIQAKEVT